jgi:SAM-dependent methyltransferase
MSDVQKLRYEDVVFEEAPCPLCGADSPGEAILVGKDFVWRKQGEFPLVPCGGCGLVYQRPRPSVGTMRYYYEDCYSGEAQAQMRRFQVESGFSRLISLYRVATIEKVRRLEPGQRVLDVGASYGGFIDFVRQRRQIEAWAIDLDPGSIEEFVNKEQVQVTCGDLLEVGYPSDHFDVVTLFETLEHVYGPVETLREVRRILRPGGLVSVEVPSWDSWLRPLFGASWFPLLLPTHLQHFSRAALRRCAQEAGLEVVHHQAMWYPTELTVSTWIVLTRLMGHKEDAQKGAGRRLLEAVLGLWLGVLFIFVDIPMLMLLRLIGRSGHQTLVARKPASTQEV